MTNTPILRDAVKQAYSAIAERPQHENPFPTGRALAMDLGYPTELLDTLPQSSVDAFCGVSRVSLFAEIAEGTTVLDVGAGAGMDTLIVARRTGMSGKVIAVDFSSEMLCRARRAAEEARATNIELRLADAERLPLSDESIDVAIVNGVFNLNPQRERIFSELSRVLKTGGSVYAAEIVLSEALSPEEQNAANWFS